MTVINGHFLYFVLNQEQNERTKFRPLTPHKHINKVVLVLKSTI